MFEQIGNLIDVVIHFDDFLPLVIEEYGTFVYFFLFLIIFLETGLVVTPYLPGDSLLFLVGAIAAQGNLSLLPPVLALLITAAIAGGHAELLDREGVRLPVPLAGGNPVHQTAPYREDRSYFEKYGGKTIVIARFAPFVRTLAPFLAGGTGKMDYSRFILFNATGGGVLWVTSFILAGYLFGNIPPSSPRTSTLLLSRSSRSPWSAWVP
ncbi:hypothetical protein [Methanoculleus chikugoensis]|uniref:hypothetical protein n=1 Tax=Methanoculleus chikugoensis TaxID=118126 RepID=UPI000A8E1C82|nr:hypothetical protein [Methanoculleus chikugoensis]